MDPKTRRAVAFYLVLGVASWDAVTRGFSKWNVALLILATGWGTMEGIAKLVWGWRDGNPDADSKGKD